MSGESFIRVGETKHQEIKQPVWLMSFADFAGCLLASFVLLYSLAQTDREKMQSAFGIAPTDTEIVAEDGAAKESMATKDAQEGRDTDYLANLLATKIEGHEAFDGVIILPQTDSVLLDLPMARLAATGSSDERDKDLVFALAGMLANIPNEAALSADLPQDGAGANWSTGMTLANGLAQRLKDSGAPDTLLARTAISADDAPHVRLIFTRAAGE
ncbi:flagellar motor protein MotB [Dongia rigui]|uniref:Flagellar motor protein MotB n=1 Tax=Dongia rigui TaxID=940149 RepID=A0ABU5DYR4_9PROT|nr:flagellar motor protein MotB [Dongia rigui]MDY0872074.1 flagellar motor protein MotB [Dongia rigui]